MKFMRLCFVFLIGVLISACASGLPSGTYSTSTDSTPTVSVPNGVATQALQPVARATSRGDKLEASAPSSVKIGAGRPVLVEFFRFT